MMKSNMTPRGFLILASVCLALALAIFVAPPLEAQTSAPASQVTVRAPKVLAVKFHADWCGYCKAMGPVIDDLENKFDGKPVLFVTLDVTNQTAKNQAEMHAAALGLSDLWTANGGGTGKIYLVDARTRQPLATLTSEQSLKEMGAKLQETLK